MATTYVGRHNPRRQVVVAGLIGSPERYDRYYDIAWEALQCDSFPLRQLLAGQLVFRKLERSIEDARTIGPLSSQLLMNRYSGVRLDGSGRLGALYLGSLSGILREHVHYTMNPPPKDGKPPLVRADGSEVGRSPASLVRGPDLTRDQINREVLASASAAGKLIFHAYRLSRAVSLADIRVPALAKLFSDLLSQPATRRKFGIADTAASDQLIQTVLASSDYSAARGIADAIADLHSTRDIAGLCATSARGDSDSGLALQDHGDGPVGEVFVLFGATGHRISVPTPVASYASFHELRDKVKALPGFVRTV